LFYIDQQTTDTKLSPILTLLKVAAHEMKRKD